ncbi:MAG: hypothetical protein FJW23_10350 [Acidimicrobiia bacterium]|nr:hypothetical protein [Acidimicrobiia bacterium]
MMASTPPIVEPPPAPEPAASRLITSSSGWLGGSFPLSVLLLPAIIGGLMLLVILSLSPAGPEGRVARSLSLIGGATVAWVLSLWWFVRRLLGAVDHLDQAMRRVVAGDYGPLSRRSMPTPYLARLQDTFAMMVDRLREAREALDAQVRHERATREELVSLQRQVIRQERLAAVGVLVSGVAHEINNPLQAILGFAELLQMQHQLPEDATRDLQLIQRESARACGIIRNLAMFARQTPGAAAPIRLADVVRSVAELRQRRLESENIELLIDVRSERPVLAVFSELQQVVLNFVVNAEQVILASGRLPGRITIRSFDNGGRVLLEVEDTGRGVPPEDEPKLFQPFFTTKAVGDGTGLGLSVSYGIIDSMGGTIGYRRAPAGGAIFHFELPGAPPTEGG